MKKIKFVGDWIEYWLRVYKKPRLKKNSYGPLEVAFRLHITSEFKAMKLKKVKLEDAEEMLSEVCTGRLREDVFSVLKNSFRKAAELKLIKVDPFVKLKGYKNKRDKGRALTDNEILYFLKNIEFHKMEELFLFYLYTGVRKCEALNVRWVDVDFNTNFIHIRGTKTDNSDRLVPIISELREILFYMKRQGEYLFPFKPDNVYRNFKKIFPNHRLHDLRHTFATKAIQSGISLPVLSKVLGHGDINVTMIYAHVMSNHEQIETQKFSLKPLRI